MKEEVKLKPGARLQFEVLLPYVGWRLDLWLRHCLDNSLSRNAIQHWIQEKHINSTAHKELSNRQKIQLGEIYTLQVPHTKPNTLQAIAIDLDFLYQDKDLAIIHKPPNIAVHPGPTKKFNSVSKTEPKQATIAQAILPFFRQGKTTQETIAKEAAIEAEPSITTKDVVQLTESEGAKLAAMITVENLRPGIVHRLDRDTEGLLLIAKHPLAQYKLMRLFAERQVYKEYTAWIWGSLSPSEGR